MKKYKCCGCKERFEGEKMLCLPAGRFHSLDCATNYAYTKQQKQRERQLAKANTNAKKEHKAERSKLKADKDRIKPKSKWLSEAQTAFNKYIRLRDYLNPCISCSKPREVIEAEQGYKTGGCWDAGHFMTRGAKGQLRFILFNVHKQCKSCNAGGGKFSAKAATVDAKYRINLIEKIGIDKVEWLENNNELDLKKGDIEYLKRIKKIFSRRARNYAKRRRLSQ